MGKLLWVGIGAVLATLLLAAASALARPTLSDDDLAYCADHADIVADIWRAQRTDLSFDPRDEVVNIAGYFRHDGVATIRLAVRTYPDSNSWGEQPPRDRVNDQLPAACRALTHP